MKNIRKSTKDIESELKQVNAKIDKDYKRGVINQALIKQRNYLTNKLIQHYEMKERNM